MARRLIVPSFVGTGIFSGGPASWAWHSSWEVTTLVLREFLLAAPDATNGPVAAGTGVAGQDRGRIACAARLGGYGLLGGTVKGQLAVRELNAAVDARAQVLLRIVSDDGSIERGVLLAHDTGALSSEYLVNTATGDSAVYENRRFPRGGAQTLTPVAYQHGDWLIWEAGHRNHGTNTSNCTYLTGGHASAGALPENETTQLTGAGDKMYGWIELSQDIVLFDEWAPAQMPQVHDLGVMLG